ncbi:hypothetical protein [Dictyobacter kobayashii]|uniref:Uncharacterized protein n=1 Tax=Dictyobacter kobayashii TaxID=2014872 RepID=A0A402AVV8_9CHLR|nr:hypothetical protein [Dictyobacter kobayashii]GCE23238.1 hypothetical protein KDK_70380 [Dictyobacter kobayashii]
MDKEAFLNQENWLGSYYELAIEYAPPHNDERLLKAIYTLWNHHTMEGPVKRSYQEEDVDHFSLMPLPLSLEPDENHRLHGKIKLTNGKDVGCLSLIIREENGSDWLDLSIPTGMLELAYHVEYPLLLPTNPWLSDIEHIFITIAEKIYEVAPFDLAIIGEEVSGITYSHTITVDDLVCGGYLVPSELFQQFRLHIPSVNLSTGLCWFPYYE